MLFRSVSLYGELGAGKTEFIKGICQYFKVEEIVTSPTFTIINQYTGFLNGKELLLYHLDLYRIKSYKELDEIGFKDCMNSENSIKLIEWAENATDFLPIPRYIVTITFDDNAEDKRIFEIAYLC